MNTCFPWKYGSVFLLTLALVGCYDYHHDDDDSQRDTSTDVVCSSDSVCDPTLSTCTSTLDETFTTFIDDYDYDFDRHTTITEDTVVTRTDDVDGTFNTLASVQTETFVVTTTEDEIVYDHDGEEHVTITTTTEQVRTTWTQDCPTCAVEVCTSSSDEPVETCTVAAAFPPVPQCES